MEDNLPVSPEIRNDKSCLLKFESKSYLGIFSDCVSYSPLQPVDLSVSNFTDLFSNVSKVPFRTLEMRKDGHKVKKSSSFPQESRETNLFRALLSRI